MLSAHCAGDFAKAGMYFFDKRAISKEKFLQSPTAAVLDKSNSWSYTAEDISNPKPTDVT